VETGNIIVLDEVTPRYLKASDAPNACSASLGIARDVLLDSGAALRRPLAARGQDLHPRIFCAAKELMSRRPSALHIPSS
jgi:hypothetical protein